MRKFTFREQTSLIYQYLTRYKEIEKFPLKSQEEIKLIQLKLCQDLIRSAYDNTDFYQDKYKKAGLHPSDIKTWKDFYQVPTVTKEEIIEAGQGAVDRRCDVDKLILSRSSGSTGQFVNLYFNAQNFITQELQVIRMLKEFYPEYGPLDKELLVYTSEYPFHSIGGFFRVNYINNLSPVEEIFAAMKRIKPVIIAIYPSVVREIAERFGEECGKIGVKAIITNSEQSSQAERDHFGNVFGCPVFDEYSSEEIPGIAYQCIHKNYHMVQDCSFVEIMKVNSDDRLSPGEEGEIVGTSFINYAMPMIRYRQGDIGTISTETCSCGKSAPIFDKLSGRMNSSLKRPDGSRIPSGKLLDWTYGLVLTAELDILEFQISQYNINEIVVSILPGKEFDKENDPIVIREGFKYTFGENLNPNVIVVSEIERTASGKHIPIRSYI